jgi:hypothetical protein
MPRGRRPHHHGNLAWRTKDRELDFCVRQQSPLAALEGLRSENSKRAAGDEMALNVESVVDGSMDGQEALC